MRTFDEATTVRRIAAGDYAATLDEGFTIGGAVHGGYLLALLQRAVADQGPHVHPVATGASFLRVARPGPARVRVEPLRQGRTAAMARAALVQNDETLVEALITSGTLDGAADPTWSGEPPPIPPLADCLSSEDHRPNEPPQGFAARVDMRFDRATMGWLDGHPGGRPEMRAYFRLREPAADAVPPVDDAPPPDAAVLALAVDALPPVVFEVGAYGWAPTVELTWHMRAVPAPGWLKLYASARLVREGWFDEEVEVWDSAGRLVAQGRQLARVGRGR
jgi:acyl-coenzyme A thioesterase PaaI-like protein